MGKKIKDCKEKNDKNMHLPNWKSAHAHTHTPKWIPNERERKKKLRGEKKIGKSKCEWNKKYFAHRAHTGSLLGKKRELNWATSLIEINFEKKFAHEKR